MRKILVAVAMVLVPFGSAFASESAMDTLKSAVSPSVLEGTTKVKVPSPILGISPHQLVNAGKVQEMETRNPTREGAMEMVEEARANMEKAGLVYITSSIQPKYDYVVNVFYAAKMSAQAPGSDAVLRFEVVAANEAEAQLKLNEIRENLPKAGLNYIVGRIHHYVFSYVGQPEDPRRTVEVMYSVRPNRLDGAGKVQDMETRSLTREGAREMVGDARINMEKAGLVYITSSIQPKYDYVVNVFYAAKKSAQAPGSDAVQRFEVVAADEAEAQLKLNEIKENLPKAGLKYVVARIHHYVFSYVGQPEDPRRTVEVTYTR